MMGSEEFKCIFCKESFNNKETLQIHFRKHGDKNFHQQKSRSQDDAPALPVKSANSKDHAEMVECDVCPEVFTSISKAITHKHKVHPDHDAKYFCPWCGKLFTMKHLYNKHIHTTHSNDEKIDKGFHCDVCNVEFNVPTAVSYHNKFFHRIFEMPSIGNSKKLTMISQEAVQIHYCPFCGEEYDNKVNLQKHMTDDHNDENQHPDDVLRCPVCDAIFYHLDAYEVHLTYHSVDDMYSERSAIMDEITDFSLETVPPIAEKVENLEPQGEAMGIEQLFELTMDDTKHKKKKHKKHKKSKKSAITLDQFLNMNTDVFGEGLDFQGVEEVHSQSIAKRLKKPLRKPAQSKLPPDIEKLKRQGIVIKKKQGTTPIKPLVFKTNKVIDKTPNLTSQTKTSMLATPDDVLTKLINQNNSQLKIFKKSIAGIKSTNQDINEMQSAIPAVDDKVPLEDAEPNGTKPALSNSNENIEDSTKTYDQETKNNIDTIKSPNLDTKTPELTETDDGEGSNHSQSILDDAIKDGGDEIKDGGDDVQTENKIVDKLTALRNNTNIVIKSSQQTVPDVNKDKEAESHNSDENMSNHEEDGDPDVNGDINNKNDSLNALKHLSHLIVKSCNQEKKPISKSESTQGVEIKDIPSEVSKIAHLIKSGPAKFVVNNGKNSSPVVPQSNPQPKTRTVESEESNVDTEDETYEHDNDKNITEPVQSDVLTSILNSPHLNVQPVKRSPKVLPRNVTPPVESLPNNEKSSADLLKHLKNVTAKPVSMNKTVDMSASSPKSPLRLVAKKEPATVLVKHSKLIQDDIEIFNIDDSDSDEANSNTSLINKSDLKEIPAPNKSAGVLKNLKKNITIKSVNNHKPVNKDSVKDVKDFECADEDSDDDKSHHAALPSNSRNTSISNPQINQKQSALNNVLKNLSKNITVKSGNSSPANFSAKTQDQNSQHSNSAHEDEGADSETDSLSGRVKITEMNDSDDEEFHKDQSDTFPQDNVKVQYPDDSNSGSEDRHDNEEFDENFSDEDIEEHITANAMKNYPISKPNLDSLKNVSKDLVIKPSGNTTRTAQLTSSDEIPRFAKSLSNRISIKSMKQADNCNTQVKTNNATSRNAEQSVSKSAINQNTASSSNQVNTVNKEVKTFKTFQTQSQTQTVIQEITTTVTKTIKTVNQSMKQEMRNAAQSSSTPRKIQQINANHINIHGTKVRQTAPIAVAGPRIRNPGIRPTRPMLSAPIRASNQLVPVSPRFNAPRQCNPRMPSVRPSTSGQQRPKLGAQVKLAPGVVTTAAKRPNVDKPGHFSCFKKTKESLFPEVDFAAMNKQEGESSFQFSSTMQMSKSNFASSTKTVKGNSVVTSTQMKSEMNASTQQLGKLRNLSGLSVVKTNQSNQSRVDDKSEVSVAKQNTLDAIQKLQNQGLLVKKPRLASEESEHSNPGDDIGNFSDEEFDS